MSRLNLEGLSVGDIVRVSQTIQVTDKKDADSENVGWIRGEDVRSGGFHYYGDFERADSVQIEMVKKAKPKPKVGDVIKTRAGLADLPALAVVTNRVDRPMIVTSEGTVAALSRTGESLFVGHGDESYGATAPYTIIYLP